MTCLTSKNLSNRDEAMAYLVECTLATVQDLAGRSRPPKGELARQISIAQTGIDWVKTFVKPGDRCGCGRVQEIIDRGLTVQTWSEK